LVLITVILVAASLAGACSSGTNKAAPKATTTTAELSTSTTAATPAPSPTAAASTVRAAPVASAATAVTTYTPWTAAGGLKPGTRVLGHLADGSCFVGGQPWSSIGASSNAHAWRCNSGDGIWDPCFAPAGKANIAELACARTPTSGVYLLALSQPLATSSPGGKSNGAWPFSMTLMNGDDCQVIQGTAPVSGDVALSYGCTHGHAEAPNTTTKQWTVRYQRTATNSLTTVAVTTAVL